MTCHIVEISWSSFLKNLQQKDLTPEYISIVFDYIIYLTTKTNNASNVPLGKINDIRQYLNRNKHLEDYCMTGIVTDVVVDGDIRQ